MDILIAEYGIYIAVAAVLLVLAAVIFFVASRRRRVEIAPPTVEYARKRTLARTAELAHELVPPPVTDPLSTPMAGIVPEPVIVGPDVISGPISIAVSAPDEPPDNLLRMKGVGPKLVTLLEARGITRFEQIAALEGDEIAALDEHMGSFKGRIVRDRWVEQARFLRHNDIEGYEAEFGKLGGSV